MENNPSQVEPSLDVTDTGRERWRHREVLKDTGTESRDIESGRKGPWDRSREDRARPGGLAKDTEKL